MTSTHLDEASSTWQLLRMAFALMRRTSMGTWIRIVVLGVFVSIVEALGAALIFALVASAAGGTHLSESLPTALTSVLPWLLDSSDTALALVIVGFFVIRALFGAVQAYVGNRAVFDTAATLSIDLMSFYLEQDYGYHVRRGSAELMRNARDSVDVIAHQVLVPLLRAGSEVLVSFGLLAALLLIAPGPTLVIVAVLASVGLAMFLSMRAALIPLGRQSHEASRASLKASQELLRGIRDIKLLESDFDVRGPFERAQRAWGRANYLRSTIHAGPRLIVETTLAILVLGVLVVSDRASASSEPVALVGLFAYAAIRLIPASALIFNALNGLSFGSSALRAVSRDISTLQQSNTDPHSSQQKLAAATLERSIVFDEISYIYPGSVELALSKVSLEVQKGSVFGIVGPSGGGKSTVVDLLTGLLHPVNGSIEVDGILLDEVEGWRQCVGLVSQASYIADDSILRNIAFGIRDEEIDVAEVSRLADLARISAFATAERGGLDIQVGELGTELSGGERQRIAIARALYRAPQILVLDEATSSLDAATEAEVLANVLEEMEGRTTVVVAHRESAIRHCHPAVAS